MAYDKYDVEYHLTPQGWVSGTEWFFGKVQKEVPPPEDRVETWIRHEEQSSGWSRPDIEWKRAWISDAVSGQEIEKLHQRFPRPR